MEVIVDVNYRTIESLNFVLDMIKERDGNNRGMRVYPDENSRALHRLTQLKLQIEKEMEEDK